MLDFGDRAALSAGLALVVSCAYKTFPDIGKYSVLAGTEKDGNGMEKSLSTLGNGVACLHNPSFPDLMAYLEWVVEIDQAI